MLSNRMIRKGMDFSIMSAVVWSFFAAATTGPVLAGLILVLKLDNIQIGLVNSMMVLVLPFQIVGAVIQQRYFPRKPFWFWMVFSQYASYMLIFMLMLLWGKLEHRFAVTIFISLFALAQMAAQLGASVWMSWMSDLVPARESNNFWNRRGGLAQVSVVLASISVGLLIDAMGRGLLSTYIWMFAVGIVFGYLSLFAQSMVPDPAPGALPQRQPIWLKFRLTWRNERFRKLITFFGIHSFFNWLLVPFIFIYMQQNLNFSMTTVQLLVALSSTVSFFSAYAFRVIGRKYGRKPVALLCAFLKGIEFIFWGMLLPGCGWAAALPAFMLGGFVNMGLGNSTMSLITSVERKKNQSFTIAVFFAVTGLLGFAGASMSGVVYNWLSGIDWIASSRLSPFNYLALVVAGGYFSSVMFFLRYKEDGSVSTVRVVKTLLANNPFRSVYHAHVLSRPMPEMNRIEVLQQAKGNLIVSELLSDLYNPSTRVRESAVLNIARNGEKADPLLEAELIKVLSMAELGVQSAAARALGHIRSANAVPVLLKFLRGPDTSLAQSCIYALGLIGDPTAINELLAVLATDKYRMLWPSAAEALGKLGSHLHTRKIFQIYLVEYNWILKQQLLIAAVRTLSEDKQQVYDYFETESKQPGIVAEKILKSLKTRMLEDGASDERGNDFNRMIDDFDHGFHLRSLERLLTMVFKRHPAVFGNDPFTPDNLGTYLRPLFGANAEIRHAALLKDDPVSVSLWLLTAVWAEMKYSSSGMDRFIYLAAILDLDRMLTSHE